MLSLVVNIGQDITDKSKTSLPAISESEAPRRAVAADSGQSTAARRERRRRADSERRAFGTRHVRCF